MAEPDDIAIGIDLGTSYSCVSIIENGQTTVIPNEWGERTHASVVSFLEDGTVLVGNSAKRNIITNADNTVYSAKRLIGRFYFSDEVKKAQAVMPYKIVEGENNSVRIQIRENGKDVFEVLSTAGDTYLGGDDFDDRIMTWLAEGFLKQNGIDLRLNKYCLQMLKEASERAKIDVGRDASAKIHVEGICQDPNGKVMNLDATLSEAEFNRMVMDLVQRTFKVCDEALQSAKMTAQDLDAIILVGGPTRLPIIRTSVKHYFGKDVMAGIDPDEVVAMGAAIQANSLQEAKGEHYLLDGTPLTLRVV